MRVTVVLLSELKWSWITKCDKGRQISYKEIKIIQAALQQFQSPFPDYDSFRQLHHRYHGQQHQQLYLKGPVVNLLLHEQNPQWSLEVEGVDKKLNG